ncbi:hypothetical protein Pint_00927 [Pistacia integerrima]|uniref:Uncharacterized protein n=1 Tax=Pistacia integerrima TaxID=434235 RepID=A0ACC0ZLK2_9ROSI|nr:hypothetical protein Pint_00927 [Pistacia integerrima]
MHWHLGRLLQHVQGYLVVELIQGIPET